MPRATIDDPAVSAAMRAAAAAVRMEFVYIGALESGTFTFARVHGSWPGIREGGSMPLNESLCGRLIAGASAATADAPSHPVYGAATATSRFGIRSYVGVPIQGPAGQPTATLCGIDHASVPVGPDELAVLDALATLVATLQSPAAPSSRSESDTGSAVTIRRTPRGWRISASDGVEEDSELANALVLADLLAHDTVPGPRPPRGQEGETDELERLRTGVRQLEHALTARVCVEQAIGVIAERQHIAPRLAFERLRKVARSRGRRVHDLSREVVASVTDKVPLPPDLGGRR